MRPDEQFERELSFFPTIGSEFWTPWDFDTINDTVWNPLVAASKNPPKGKDAKGKEKDKSTTTQPADKTDGPKDTSDRYFVDTEVPILPEKYLKSVLVWKRPYDLFPDVPAEELATKVSIYSGKQLELHELNQHLLACSYYNHILDAFESLRLYEGFEVADFGDFGFTGWNPTNNIYALSPVKKGEPHQVQFNPYGKYIVRLYHCGKWRQIQVDDRIPLDFHNKVLLPCIFTNDQLELWPLLISKAILKLNFYRLYDDGYYYIDQRSTHQCRMYDGDDCKCKDYIPVRKYYLYNESELFRINALHLLTGWYPEEYDFSAKRSEQVWDAFQKLLPQFQYPKRARSSEVGKKVKGKGKQSVVEMEPQDNNDNGQVHESRSLITLDFMLEAIKNSKRNLFMEVNCSQFRDVPLDESTEQIDSSLPLWKTYRWMYWATEKGIWKPDIAKKYWSVLCFIPNCRHELFKSFFEQEWAEKLLKSKEQQADQASLTGSRKSAGDQKGKAAANKKKTSAVQKASKERIDQSQEEVQPKVWISFNKLIRALECVKLYHKDHKFQTNIFISNEDPPVKTPPPVEAKPPAKPNKKGQQPAVVAAKVDDETNKHLPSVHRVYGEDNIPLYLFVDHEQEDDALMDLTVLKNGRYTTEAKVKIERYRWNCLKQQLVTELVSIGLNGCRIGLGKGRTVYRITCSSKGYCFHIRSNSPNIKITDKDGLLELMSDDSILFEHYVQNIIKFAQRYIESIGQPGFEEDRYAFFLSLMDYFIDATIPETRVYMLQQLKVSLFNMIKHLPDIKRTLRRFLISTDPNWTCTPVRSLLGKNFLRAVKKLQKARIHMCDCPGSKPIFTPEQEHEILKSAALKIQSFMKMCYVKQLLRYHDPKEPNKKHCDQLKANMLDLFNQYCTTQTHELKDFIVYFLFESNFQGLARGSLLRLFDTNRLFAELYEFYNDFHSMVRKLSKTHDIPPGLQAGQWHPLKTGCLFCHSEKVRRYMLRIKSSPDAPKVNFFVKLLSNDDLKLVTMSEIEGMWPLLQNKYGYKLFVYMYVAGDANETLPSSWTLDIISPKHAPLAHFCNFCNETPDPCKPTADPSLPLSCIQGELQDFQLYSDSRECSSDDVICGKYLIKIQQPVHLSIFMSCSSDLLVFEAEVVQTQTQRVLTKELDTGKLVIIGLHLKPINVYVKHQQSTEFSVTISLLRRARAGYQVSGRLDESAGGSPKLAGQSEKPTGRLARNLERFTMNIKFAYDQDASLEVEKMNVDLTV